MMRARLAKAWGGISPAQLRDFTVAEITAMTEVLEEWAAEMEKANKL